MEVKALTVEKCVAARFSTRVTHPMTYSTPSSMSIRPSGKIMHALRKTWVRRLPRVVESEPRAAAMTDGGRRSRWPSRPLAEPSVRPGVHAACPSDGS